MTGSHYLSKSSVSRSCVSCRRGREHYCRKCLGWSRRKSREFRWLEEGPNSYHGDMNPATGVLLDPYIKKRQLAQCDMNVPSCFLKAGINLLLMSSVHICCLFVSGSMCACFLAHLMIIFLGHRSWLHLCLHKLLLASMASFLWVISLQKRSEILY